MHHDFCLLFLPSANSIITVVLIRLDDISGITHGLAALWDFSSLACCLVLSPKIIKHNGRLLNGSFYGAATVSFMSYTVCARDWRDCLMITFFCKSKVGL